MTSPQSSERSAMGWAGPAMARTAKKEASMVMVENCMLAVLFGELGLVGSG